MDAPMVTLPWRRGGFQGRQQRSRGLCRRDRARPASPGSAYELGRRVDRPDADAVNP